MRHIGFLAGAALAVLVPSMAAAQMGAPTGAPMQPGGWSQGGWQSGGAAAPTYEPGAQDYRQGYSQAYAQQGYADHARMRGHDEYRRLGRGKRLPGAYLDPRYTVSDWNDWGFAPPGPGMRWVRYYDDGMLVDDRGRIVDARYGVDWNRRGPHGARGYGPGPMMGGYGPGPIGGPGYPPPGVSSYRAGPNTTVTTTVVPAPPPMIVSGPAFGGGYYGGGASVISVTPGVAVTTTTTTTDYETVYKSVAVKQRAWRRPIHHARPHCVQRTSCPVLGS